MKRVIGRRTSDILDNEYDNSVAKLEIEGAPRKRLDDRIQSWLNTVPEAGFFDGQRKLSDQETREWLETAKRLKQVKLNEEIKAAGSWVGDKFYPDGFW